MKIIYKINITFLDIFKSFVALRCET